MRERPADPSVTATLLGRGAELVPSSARERAELLDRTMWSYHLSWADEEGIARYVQRFRFPAGAVVFHEGDSDAFALIVVDGSLEIRKDDSTQHERVVAHLKRGKIVGEMSLLDGAQRSATAVCLEAMESLVLSRDDFERMSVEQPRVALTFAIMIAKAIAQLLRQTTGTLVDHLERNPALRPPDGAIGGA